MIVLGLKYLKYIQFKSSLLKERAHSLIYTKGNPNARVKILEYFTFDCVACAKSSKILDEYQIIYPKALYLEATPFPLQNHVHSMDSAAYAECMAQQGKYWAYHDLLFKTQQEWYNQPKADDKFRALACSLNIDTGKLDACVKDPGTAGKILRGKEKASKIGISATPTFFVNGKLIVGSQALERELKVHFPDERKT